MQNLYNTNLIFFQRLNSLLIFHLTLHCFKTQVQHHINNKFEIISRKPPLFAPYAAVIDTTERAGTCARRAADSQGERGIKPDSTLSLALLIVVYLSLETTLRLQVTPPTKLPFNVRGIRLYTVCDVKRKKHRYRVSTKWKLMNA